MLPDDVLLGVRGPARYLNGEWNVSRPSADARIRLALCYPDVYQVGMGHLGSLILYHAASLIEGVSVERCYAPWPDAAEELRRLGLPLATLESHTPLRDCDLVGFTLQYELTYPTLLTMLSLGGIPRRSADRQPGAPLVIAGGPGAANPEPLASFIDLFCLGDGEELLADLLRRLLSLRESLGPREGWATRDRETVLRELASLPGVYWPDAYEPRLVGDLVIPQPRSGVPERVSARLVENLDAVPFPTAPPVPWVETIHDRGQIEIARGCTRGCRFCQAGMIYRPVRERSVEILLHQAEELVDNTGYDGLSLVALNCPDYQRIEELIGTLQARLSPRGVSLSLPSLRVDTMSVELAQRLAETRKGGMTFAPEAGSQRLRDIINKNISEEDLLRAVEAACRAGWLTVKLYFMIGLPTEADEDLHALAELVHQVVRAGCDALGGKQRRLKVNVSVAIFNPKAHTPFQWNGQAPRAEIEAKQELLQSLLQSRYVKLSVHNVGQSCIEAVLARGDRRLGDVLEKAADLGCYLDPWTEWFDAPRWHQAFDGSGRTAEEWASRELDPATPLPWDVIDMGVTRDFLLRERELALSGRPTADCRAGSCHACGNQRRVRGCSGVLPASCGGKSK